MSGFFVGAIACGKALLKAKEKVGHGGWGRLFSESNEQSEGSKNCSFAFTKNQANRYIKVASYPALARQALLEDQGAHARRYVTSVTPVTAGP